MKEGTIVSQFENQVFGSLTTIRNEKDEVFFLASEVATHLSIGRVSDMVRSLVDKKHYVHLTYAQGVKLMGNVDALSNRSSNQTALSNRSSNQTISRNGMKILTESGLYKVLMKSSKKEASVFQDWIVDDVLPSIRKTGSYSVQKQIQKPLTFLELIDLAKASELARIAAEQKVIEQKQELVIAAPKVEFHDKVVNSTGTISIGKFAKFTKDTYGLGRNKLFARLREMKILGQDRTPMQTYMDRGYFKVKEGVTDKGIPYAQTVITGKGQVWLTKELDNYTVPITIDDLPF